MIVLVDLKQIDDNPFQERTAYGQAYIEELAASITSLRDTRDETLGLIHVPVARPVNGKGTPLAGLDLAVCRFQLSSEHSACTSRSGP